MNTPERHARRTPPERGDPPRLPPWWHLRATTDLLALVCILGIAAQTVDRFVNGTPADPTLLYGSILGATGAAGVPRVRDALLKRYGGAG